MQNGKITYLDGIRLHRGFTAGIRHVISQKDYLNKINVFPVPDGDTGTNLAFTLSSILEGTVSVVNSHVGHTAISIADAAIDGARGNSGLIFAQFLQGFSDACWGIKRLTTDQFVHAMEVGSQYAREALSEPCEGTILSVIDAYVDSLRKRVTHGVTDFFTLMKYAVKHAEDALRKTPKQLEILRKRNVVDAGGQGFVYFQRGILEFVSRGSIRGLSEGIPSRILRASASPVPPPKATEEYRYCTECLVADPEISRRHLRECLMELGGSLVMAGSKTRMRIHIHTDTPNAVFDLVRDYGEVGQEKVDDMLEQSRVANERHAQVAVVTDSTADIPQDLLERYDIHVIPVKLNIGKRIFLDKVTITPEEFLDELATNPEHPQTSQPAPGDFRRYYQFLTSHYESVISIHLSRAVSGTLQSAEHAARRIAEGNITVMDGLNVSGGLGLIVMAAARAAQEGKSHDEIVEMAEQAIRNTKIYAAVRDLSFAVRGGRVSRSHQRIADLLRATPVLNATPEGRIDRAGLFFGRNNMADKLARWIASRTDLTQSYHALICHSGCLDAAERLRELLPDAGIMVKDLHITATGAALSAHTGPGSLILALQPASIA